MEKSGHAKQTKFKLKKLKFRKIKTWQLLVLLIPLLFIDATLLRIDHLKMTELRTAVLEADASEDYDALSSNLESLKDFVFHNIVINVVEDNGEQHVTFGTGPFYLEHLYRRDATAALEEAQSALANYSNPNGNVYQAASSVCEPQAIANGWEWNNPAYVNCMVSEIQKYPTTNSLDEMISVNIPSTELYRKNFASPLWAPTITGFMLLFTLILIVVIFIRMLIWLFLRISLLFV